MRNKRSGGRENEVRKSEPVTVNERKESRRSEGKQKG